MLRDRCPDSGAISINRQSMHLFVELRCRNRNRQQSPAALGPLGSYDKRAVTSSHDFSIEDGEDLLCASSRILRHAGKWIADAEDRQRHANSPYWASACDASSRQRSPVI